MKLGNGVVVVEGLKDQLVQFSLSRKLLLWALYCFLPFLLLHLYLTHAPFPISPPTNIYQTTLDNHKYDVLEEELESCDYFSGKWIPDLNNTLLYNDSSCSSIIKEGQNCVAHGRTNTTYLNYRWKPSNCSLPRFDPAGFLSLAENSTFLFVGDSIARNQFESLLCLLSSFEKPDLVHSDEGRKFRTWNFASYNVTVAVIWSPFLVQGVEKNEKIDHNMLYLDNADEKWRARLKEADFVVFYVGHWFLHPAVYFEKNKAIGCHYCPGTNHTEIEFFEPLRKAVKTSLRSIVGAKRKIHAVVVTFSPAHFEGEWDKNGACSLQEPYRDGEKELGSMDEDLRRVEIEEVERFQGVGKQWGVKIEALDVTKLAFMRPDAHPGPYMHPFPFKDGVKERVQNDCVHWCLPGAIDTWNEILLQKMKRWKQEHSRNS